LARAAELEPVPAVRAIEALLLGAGRFLDSPADVTETDEGQRYLAESRRLWRLQGAPAGVPIAAGGPRRPANHPARRLAGLARLLAGGPEALLARLRTAVLTSGQPVSDLPRLLTVPADGLWCERLVPWGPRAPAAPPALIGTGKALELALNAALPVLLGVAERGGERQLVEATLRAFHALPSPPAYGRTAHLYRALRSDGRTVIQRADQSQAALHLYAYYCTRGGCGRCPLS
jgi:hypothetical protein